MILKVPPALMPGPVSLPCSGSSLNFLVWAGGTVFNHPPFYFTN